MTTLYRFDTLESTDMEGHEHEWYSNNKYDTLEVMEAKALSYESKANSYYDAYRIVARTIDETSFLVVDEIIKEWGWWHEIGFLEKIKGDLKWARESIPKLEAKKSQTKSEAKKIKIDKEIAERKQTIEEKERILASRK